MRFINHSKRSTHSVIKQRTKMSAENNNYWKGNSMDEIYRGLGAFELRHFPHLDGSHNHKVLFEFPANPNSTEPLKPHVGETKWDAYHVRLPCATQSETIVNGEVIFIFEQ